MSGFPNQTYFAIQNIPKGGFMTEYTGGFLRCQNKFQNHYPEQKI